jgi:phosphatidylinositol-3-phosphatase
MGMFIVRRVLAAAIISGGVFVGAAVQAAPPTPAVQRAVGGYTKVLVIAEENRTYAQFIGSKDAPYLTGLAAAYGSATNMTANYPVSCPSLAGYILMTSGTTSGICDDTGPKHHLLTGDNIFAQAAAAHLGSRTYAENSPGPCARKNSPDGVFLVRHTPAAYYTSENSRCAADDIAWGTLASGGLRGDITNGTLPSYAFVTPNACHDMHGAASCPDHRVADGDNWLAEWIPVLLHGTDYRAGRLVIIITWDEGSATSNHIPTLVISPTTRAVSASGAYTHCSTLRTAEDILHLPALGCAQTAPAMTGAFHL